VSKAFTKESDDAAEPLPPAGPEVPEGTPNLVTPTGIAALRRDLAHARDVERPAAQAALAAAEGAGVNVARRRLAEVDHRLAWLARQIDTATVVGPPPDPERVRFGATVTVRDGDDRVAVYRIVGVAEADPKEGRVSWRSPLAQALIGAAVGDVVTARLPRGDEELGIEGVAY
jgi:transcription elongation factor GreB